MWLDDIRRLRRGSAGAEAPWPPRHLSLALQGGGYFGAFTWGVLDRLLEEEDIEFDAVSGASAGAVNAVLLAAGLVEGSRQAARQKLRGFWHRMSKAASFVPFGGGSAFAGLTPGASTLSFWTRLVSPYQFNPFDLNPLRTALNEEIDFERLREFSPVRLMISATRVSDGRARIFENHEISAETVLASSCLPLLHHAVTVEDETYWDGGYAANPPLIPLVAETVAPDILIVQLTPMKASITPTTSRGISGRLDQINFNSSLLTELEALSRFTDLCRSLLGVHPSNGRKQRRLRIHRVAAEEEFEGLAEASAIDLNWAFLTKLRDSGRAAADAWLHRNESVPRPMALEWEARSY